MLEHGFSLLALFFASLATSTLAGVLGLGGGMLLIAILPSLLVASAIIPLHALTQLSSNGSRAYFAHKSIRWPLLKGFLIGSMVGVIAATVLLSKLSLEVLPVFIGAYILLGQWWPHLLSGLKRWQNPYALGCLQSGLGILVGTTGPLTISWLQNQGCDKEQIVATSALMMLISHSLKLVVFATIGISVFSYWSQAISLIAGAIAGSWLGTRLRLNITPTFFSKWLKLVLTLLAVNMIFRSLF